MRPGVKATDYRRKVENHIADNNMRQVWQGLQHYTNYKGNTMGAVSADASLVEKLNHFFTCFEAKESHSAALNPQLPNPNPLILQ